MHLKQLKLAGFKSFVDPTVVHFPSQLVAVLGPNGCGKSNIIDAVRWVMGESSAKNLRGESMTDVIFNGSSNRRPVGQASVELVFDNSLGRLVGPFASYGEIAVKRIVTRDGDSTYYLNGSKCRRKDVTDIFLGTGAGARGYSIIGQGTISRLIEAKPEELRAFLEEAAGVSKYKERRRETLQRIGQTQENLNRVADIRDELDKQLQRLERQAKAAERYTLLKEEEALCRAEISALKWQDFNAQQLGKQNELYDLTLRYEQQNSVITHVQTQKTLLNERLHEADNQAQHIQTSFYQLGTEVARLEESIQQQQREKKRLETDRQQMQEDWHNAQEQLKQDQEHLLNSQQSAHNLLLRLEQVTQEFNEQTKQLDDGKEQQVLADRRWQEVQNKRNTLKNELQIAQIKVQHIEQNRRQLSLRLEKIHQEQEAVDLGDLESNKIKLEAQQNELQRQQQDDEEQLKSSLQHANLVRNQLQETEQQVHSLQNEFHRLNSDYAALVAVQKAARHGTKENKEIIAAWTDKPRLMDVLQVEPQWQFACERILSDELHAYVLDDISELWPQWEHCERLGESVLTLAKANPSASATRVKLIEKIHGPIPRTAYPLEHIYIAEHSDEAIQWLPELLEHESIITQNGFWLAKGWVKLINHAEQDDIGLLARQQKITEISLIVDELQQKIEDCQNERENKSKQLHEVLKANDLLQLTLNASSESLRNNQSALTKISQEIAHGYQIRTTLLEQAEELRQQLEDFAIEQLQFNEQVSFLTDAFTESEGEYLKLGDEKQQHLSRLAELQQEVDKSRSAVHQAELEHDRESTKIQQLTARIVREQERLLVLEERLEHLASLCMQSTAPEVELQDKLTEYLLKHGEVETQLTMSREQLAQIRMELEEHERLLGIHDVELKRLHELISQSRMEEQALAVRASAVQESLNEMGLQAQLLLENIAQGISQSMREDELIALTEKIKRLGAINLAAIEEFANEQQRKTYLDEQHADLSEALATLQTAIEKMDKETRTRLENTFAEVNNSFKSLFPRLFGGGRAQLELTCDNLLEAGIVVMAQPPGKRNSTIHLLSGGEKAMTAVALVFAIFQLNPSPFCMLDEVDAPLDDVNVGRFCALVKEMSQFVQFLFITHNKVTMELADHLIGVTMREPGVSRLVAVDVKEALTME